MPEHLGHTVLRTVQGGDGGVLGHGVYARDHGFLDFGHRGDDLRAGYRVTNSPAGHRISLGEREHRQYPSVRIPDRRADVLPFVYQPVVRLVGDHVQVMALAELQATP